MNARIATGFESVVTGARPAAAIAVRGLRKTFDETVALDNLDLDVQPGEVMGILGPNGAGKTTLLGVLEGLLDFDAGEVTVLGHDIPRDAAKLHGRAHVVMQAQALPPALTPLDLVRLYQAIYDDRRPPLELLTLVGIEEKRGARISGLSGGQKQRLAIALALIGRGDLMFLDEPTSELDPQGRRLVWDVLREDHQRSGRTTLITTHQMEEAATLCDRVVILDHGRVIAQGTPSELIQAHCPGLTLVFRCEPCVDLPGLAARHADLKLNHLSDTVEVRLVCRDFAHAMEEAAALRSGIGAGIRQMTVEAHTLEDVFLLLTGRALRD